MLEFLVHFGFLYSSDMGKIKTNRWGRWNPMKVSKINYELKH